MDAPHLAPSDILYILQIYIRLHRTLLMLIFLLLSLSFVLQFH